MSSQPEEAEVLRHLARYFRDNPLACDTAEGALRWWLPQEKGFNENMVIAALEALVTQGGLETLPAVDGRVRYRRVEGLEAHAILERQAREPAGKCERGQGSGS